jgi:hypothetical protein
LELGIEVKAEAALPPAPAQPPLSKTLERDVGISREPTREHGRPSGVELVKAADSPEKARTLSVEESVEPREKKSHRRRRHRRKSRDKERFIAKGGKSFSDKGREEPAIDVSPPAELAAEKADVAGIELKQETQGDQMEKHPSQLRRSRRGSRKRKKKGGETAQEKAAPLKKVLSPQQTDSAALTGISSATEPEEEIIDEEDEDRGKGSVKSAFRAIPTWEEAVRIIVSKNIESRPKRHGNGSSPSRGAQPREKRRK